MKKRMVAAGIWMIAGLYGAIPGQDALGQTVVTNLVVEGYLAVEGTIEQGDSTATGFQSTAFGDRTEASGDYSHAEGRQTVAAGTASHAGGAFARVRPQDTNAFIHATGTSSNNMKETQFPNTAHFDHIVAMASGHDVTNAVWPRWQNDARYMNKLGDSMVGPLVVQGSVTAAQYLNPNNDILDSYSLAMGGMNNIADDYSAVAGGWSNAATQSSGPYQSSSPCGYAFVGGGQNNAASGFSAIGGGSRNFASWVSAIGGGFGNIASNWSFVGGGVDNVAAPSGSSGAFVGAGQNNKAFAQQSSIVGGEGNVISNQAWNSIIGGGQGNTLSGRGFSVIGGGAGNSITSPNSGPLAARQSIIGGGGQNRITSGYASILGGFSNLVSGLYGTAGGYGAQALHSGSWVWADAQGTAYASSTSNEFAVRASGGVRLDAKLQVNGEVRFNGPIYILPAGDLDMGTYTNGMLP